MSEDALIILENEEGFKRKINRLAESILSKKLTADIGMFIMKTIKDRTLKGEDYRGETFQDYSEEYALFREKKGYQTNYVDLTLTGSMLSAMTYDADKDSVSVYFMNTDDPSGSSNPEKAFYLNEDREFFNLSQDEIDQVMGIVEEYYQKLIRMG